MVRLVTGAAVMQQLRQQSPLDKGDPNNATTLLPLSQTSEQKHYIVPPISPQRLH